jgi:hypothetical protein
MSFFERRFRLYLREFAARNGSEKLFFAVNEVCSIESGQFEAMSVCDGVRWTCLHTIATEDAAVIVDVIDRRITLSATNTVLSRVLGSLDVNAIRRTRSSTEKAGNALLQPIFVAL